MKHVLSSSLLPRAMFAAGAMLLATVYAASAAPQDSDASAPAPASASDVAPRETLKGTVASTNERSDTLTLQNASTGASDDFKVRDGLIFNAVRFGDPVGITVETVDGVKTIVALTKQ